MNAEEIQQKLTEIENLFFSRGDSITVEQGMESIPLVAANVSKATKSFSKGQLLYVYDGFAGKAERFVVVGRYRRKHRFVKGVCPRASLENHRPKVVYDPEIIRKLVGKTIKLSTIIGSSADGL